VEEIYRALIEEGVLLRNGGVRITRPLSALKILTTAQAILAARIDRLPSEQKDLLETVAGIGKDFRLELVGKVVARPREELERTLAQLQLAEFIYEQPAAPTSSTGSFTNSLGSPHTTRSWSSGERRRTSGLHTRLRSSTPTLFGRPSRRSRASLRTQRQPHESD
jgi:hypothetical protein